MKIITRNLIGLLLIAAALIVSFDLFAQTNAYEITPKDEAIRDTLSKYSWVKVFIVPVTTVFVMLFRKFVGFIPDQMWPWLAPFIGVGIDFIAAKIGFWTGNVGVGLAMGAAGTWFHQIGSQTKEMATTGLTTTTGGETEESNKST
jgi:hypothetical protein